MEFESSKNARSTTTMKIFENAKLPAVSELNASVIIILAVGTCRSSLSILAISQREENAK